VSRGRAEAGTARELKLGHILYSNCFPVHARLLDRPRPGDPEIVAGIPSTLNRLLAEGAIDVAPSSSIEYALHADRYRILPELVIGSRGPVRSILFLSDREPEDLSGKLIALPTASATSVLLLKILLRTRWKVETRFRWFDQAVEDPFAAGAAAALFIGDVALRPSLHPDRLVRKDLGLEWWEQTRLPFAFALWQVSTEPAAPAIRSLHRILLDSRAYGYAQRATLARRYADRFGMAAGPLERYWTDLAFDLDAEMIDGLRAFYRLAAEIGEIERAPELRWALADTPVQAP
jgi:chorismate dehydratase